MDKLFAVCGLKCDECEAYIATKNNDNVLRKKLADEWSKLYQYDFKIEDINCSGCRVEGNHIGYCAMCEIRKCGNSKKIECCGLCSEYPNCNILNSFFSNAPEEGAKKIKANLEKISKNKKS